MMQKMATARMSSKGQTEGTHGPFKDLDDYAHNFYLKYHPKHRALKWDKFGWSPWRSFEPW